MPENPLLKVFGSLADLRHQIARLPIVREGVVQADGSILLDGDTTPLPDTIRHDYASGDRIAVQLANNRVYPFYKL